ncbi:MULTISPECIES: hydroxyethylthiazole kinase [unclassified Aureimonas]|uniref:hydroxyethylthiazole kinase n=1 Tax=unclassified Aureimonas TaxID=2615206 RepID=UPI0006F51A86|nr:MULTISPECIES: hydroxyethylthiazole kinase [unclassified Aureimonas]KQT69653.1 hydroxyethylthiazole kinase [Aureimonas sp. Leaf427]KQT76193.1 hydroxyethylthiazole kinase [Aureimonas sp. Leaf460]
MSHDIETVAVADVLARLRERRPRVHCLLNTVVQNLVADGLTALGAVPSMTASPEEIVSFVGRADALLVNLGTLSAERAKVSEIAAAEAVRSGKPWVLDPVKCEDSPTRLALARRLVAAGPFAVKVNASEAAALAPAPGILVVETGPSDQLRLGDRRAAVANGHARLAGVTGTGCLAGAILAACAAVEPDKLLAGAAAMAIIGVAAEIAAPRSRGPGSFAVELLDALGNLSAGDLFAHTRIRHAGA